MPLLMPHPQMPPPLIPHLLTPLLCSPRMQDWVEDLLEDAGEDLFEELIEDVADVAEDISEDLLDELVDDHNVTTTEKAEEAAEVAEEVAEEAAEADAEEEEAEVEAATELGLLEDAERRATFYGGLVRNVALCAVGAEKDCNYFDVDEMSSTPSVPEAYYAPGLKLGDEGTFSPPFFFGERAVRKKTPLLIATEEHYRVRQAFDENEKCKGVKCTNITVLRPTEDADRYELVPAAAMLTPVSDIRWPLQLRIQTAAVYRHRSAKKTQPLLISFDKLQFDPEFTYYSNRPGKKQQRYQSTSDTPKLLIILVICVLLLLCCAACNRVTTLLSSEAPSPNGADDSSSASPGSSRSPSPMISLAGLREYVNRSPAVIGTGPADSRSHALRPPVAIAASAAPARTGSPLAAPRPLANGNGAHAAAAATAGSPMAAPRARIDPLGNSPLSNGFRGAQDLL